LLNGDLVPNATGGCDWPKIQSHTLRRNKTASLSLSEGRQQEIKWVPSENTERGLHSSSDMLAGLVKTLFA
jgi:hypothetical protein